MLIAFIAIWVIAGALLVARLFDGGGERRNVTAPPEPSAKATAGTRRAPSPPDGGFIPPTPVAGTLEASIARKPAASLTAESPAATRAPTPPPSPAADPELLRLVSMLAGVNIQPGALTPQSAAAWKGSLDALIRFGAAAVPAIRDFLASGQDVSFEAVPGAAEVLGHPTLRLALLNALTSIPGPTAIALSADTLRTTVDPREIALVSNSLESLAPGQYREASLAAARRSLSEAFAGKIREQDLGPLFDVFGRAGGTDAVPDLQHAAAGQWKYYASIALARLPDGAGVPALVQMAADPNSSPGGRSVALQMLGEVAGDVPDARAALVEEARRGDIADATWTMIAATLGGDRFQIGKVDPAGIPNIRTWYLKASNQNFYAAPEALSAEQIRQRIGTIDQLLAVKPGGSAIALLQDARNRLQGQLAAPTTQTR